MLKIPQKHAVKAPTFAYYLTPLARQRGITFEAPRPGDAGYDVRASETAILIPGVVHCISTGLHLSIPDGYVGIVKDRSSKAAKGIYTHGGVIDAGYRGELLILLENASEEHCTVQTGDKIAQLVIVSCLTAAPHAVYNLDQLGTTARGTRGFGSTGK